MDFFAVEIEDDIRLVYNGTSGLNEALWSNILFTATAIVIAQHKKTIHFIGAITQHKSNTRQQHISVGHFGNTRKQLISLSRSSLTSSILLPCLSPSHNRYLNGVFIELVFFGGIWLPVLSKTV
jgi:hypothetical protein